MSGSRKGGKCKPLHLQLTQLWHDVALLQPLQFLQHSQSEHIRQLCKLMCTLLKEKPILTRKQIVVCAMENHPSVDACLTESLPLQFVQFWPRFEDAKSELKFFEI
jgi:hypothetical protein